MLSGWSKQSIKIKIKNMIFTNFWHRHDDSCGQCHHNNRVGVVRAEAETMLVHRHSYPSNINYFLRRTHLGIEFFIQRESIHLSWNWPYENFVHNNNNWLSFSRLCIGHLTKNYKSISANIQEQQANGFFNEIKYVFVRKFLREKIAFTREMLFTG